MNLLITGSPSSPLDNFYYSWLPYPAINKYNHDWEILSSLKCKIDSAIRVFLVHATIKQM